MASPSPWIADTLIDALDVYLALEFEEKEPEEIGVVLFKYIRSIDHLSILVGKDPNTAVRLLSWQVSPTGKLVEALVTDGKIEIKSLFLRTALNVAQHSHSSISVLRAGSVLRLYDFDFCLVDSLEPPRVTLYLRKFDVLPRADITQTGNLSTIGDHEQARNYLSLWKDFEKSRIMGPYPGSPQEIQSQIGEDEEEGNVRSDSENQDYTSVSQAQFATQIPLQESRKLRPQGGSTTSAKVIDRYKRFDHGEHVQQEEALQTSAEKRTHNATVLQPEGDNISPSPELTQVQIVAPSASAQIEKPVPEKTKRHENGDQSQNSASNVSPREHPLVPEKVPDSVMQMLMRLRKECQDDRYVPRRLQSIPKDQAKLLALDDRWQPPLVGCVQRPGTVPLDLLNRLTERADQADVVKLLPQTEPMLATTETSNSIYNNIHVSNEDSNDSDDDHSTSPEDIEWPSSPLRMPVNQRLLPPDSPLRLPATQNEDTVQTQQGNTSRLSHGKETISATRTIPKPILTRKSDLHNITRTSSASATASAPLPPSTLRSTVELPHTIPPRTVQVKRTPFQAKEAPSVDELPDSSAIIVPGTFDEHAVKRGRESVQDARTIARLSDRVLADGNDDDFEMDTSEDEIAARNGRSGSRHSSATTSNSKGVGTRLRSEDENFIVKQPSQSLNTSVKRKIKNYISRPKKRMKSNERDVVHGGAITSEYDDIDQDRARQRREFLGRIGKKRDLLQPAPMLTSSALAKARGASSSISQRPDTEVWGSSPLPRAQVDAPDTYSAILPDSSTSYQLKVSEQFGSTIPRTKLNISSELYNNFRSTYPSYGGDKKHFDAACQILKKLHLQDKATHQSLWDDFVFRHFHDYRNYLLDVMENCGNAIPYEKYYEEYVEQPTCLRRLIRPAYINDMSVDPVSVTRSSLGPDSSTAPDETHLKTTSRTVAVTARSIAVESSVSSNIANQASNEIPPQEERERTTLQTDELKSKHGLLQKELSQESRTSVRIWLERAAGAESPILGTTEAGTSREKDIPILELTDETLDTSDLKQTLTQQQKKRRSLPWQNSQDVVSSRSVLDSGVRSILPNNDRLRVQHRRSLPSITQKSITGQPRPSNSTLNKGTIHRISTEVSKGNQSNVPDTVFTRFTTFYKALPGESKALKHREADASKLVNIFSWRR